MAVQDLPAEWIRLTEEFQIIPSDKRIPEGYENGDRYWYFAKVHYRWGENGKEYFLGDTNDIAELLRLRVDPEYPGLEMVSKRWVYGVSKDLKPAERIK